MARGNPHRQQLDDAPKVKLTKENLSKSLQLFKYVLPYKWAFIMGMVMLTLGSLIFVGIMKVPGEIFNVIENNSRFDISLNQLFLVLTVLLVLQAVFSFFRVQLFAIVSEKSIASVRQDLYERLISLPLPFFEERRVGELTSRISNDVTQVQSAMSTTLAEFIRQIIVFIGGVAIIVFTMPRLALLILLTFPLVVIAAMFFGKYIRKLMKERQDKIAQTNVVVEETMQNIQDVKSYTNEWFEVGRYASYLKESVQIALSAAKMRGLFAAFIILVMFGALFFIMWRAAIMVQSGDMLKGDLVDFVVFTGIIGGAIASLGSLYTQLVSAVGSSERILEILNESPEIELRTTKKLTQEDRFTGDISFENVHFSYPTRPDIEVLKGIDLKVPHGQKIALVGASGAGKSTIAQLLLQFYKITDGKITVDGQNIYDYDLTKYRQNLAIVPQEVMLFGGTIKENIQYGTPDATDAEIEAAAKKANALEFINSFPEGMDTIVGERGVKLSGGQRQRIAIARAILKDPAILILDEATSALDAESEKVVQEALEVLMQNRTSIIIAHRLATIRNVDRIYVLEDGHVVESGTHDELSHVENGVYNTLAKLQFAEVE